MLEKADRRVWLNGWSNVELIQSDADVYQFPDTVSGILSTFAMTLIPEYDEIIQKGAAALPPGKRFVILDFKKPENWPMWLVKLFVIVTRPFGVMLDLAERHPWESIDRYMTTIEFRELYFGVIYLCVGKAG
jgi:demethylmenaquinone methyltransferase/2-methoxy-6-polyprenyl-1,4-benzoquinol methylase